MASTVSQRIWQIPFIDQSLTASAIQG